MRKLIVFALALLLFVVAFAGLSPPTKKDNATAIASAHVMSHIDMQADAATRVASISQDKEIIPLIAVVTATNPYKQSEVTAVARAGSQQEQNKNLMTHEPLIGVESDVGAVLLL